MKYKVVFAGTPDFASFYLKSLIKDDRFFISKIITQEDKKVGREQKLMSPDIKKVGIENNIEVLQPLRKKEIIEILKKEKPDFFVVVAYGKILPKDSLEIAKFNINVHGSILPKYRGASPIQSAILNGEKETGVSIMNIEEKMDTGSVWNIHNCEIGENDTSIDIFDKLAKMSEFFPNDLDKIFKGELNTKEQNESEATYCNKIEKEDGKINWNDFSKNIFNKFKAFTPWPGIWTEFNGKKLKLVDIKKSDFKIEIGKIEKINGKILIGTKKGSIELFELQLEGKKSQKIGDFINGQRDFIGSKI